MQIIDSTTFIYRVEGAIEFGLDSPVEESDEENDELTWSLWNNSTIWFRMDRCQLHRIAPTPPKTHTPVFYKWKTTQRACDCIKAIWEGVQAVQLKESAIPITSWRDQYIPPSIASFVQQCYPHKNQGHTKQPLHLTKQMGKLSMEAVPALQVVQPAITLLHWCLQLTTWTEHMLAKEVVGGRAQFNFTATEVGSSSKA